MAVVYNNSELGPWLSLIPQKKQRPPSPEASQSKITRSFPLTLTVDAWDMSAVALFQGAMPMRSGLTHLHFQLMKHPATGLSTCEFRGETLWCCMGNKSPSDPSQKKLHFWNAPLYVGLLFGKVDRHMGLKGIVDSVQYQLLLDVARFEWSPNLMDSIVAIQRYFTVCRCWTGSFQFFFSVVYNAGYEQVQVRRLNLLSVCKRQIQRQRIL